MSTNPVWEPPRAGTDAEQLLGALDRLRYTFRWKADGLDADGLAFRILSSELSIGGLLKHLAAVESAKFTLDLDGSAPDAPFTYPGKDEQWAFASAADDSAHELYALYDTMVERSRARLGAAVERGGLDQHVALGKNWGLTVSLRRLVTDLIEEYGRHTGHTDLLREAIDGRVGEDPPSDWLPSAEGGSATSAIAPPTEAVAVVAAPHTETDAVVVAASDDGPAPSYDEALDAASRHARSWLSGVRERPIPPRAGIAEVTDRLGRDLPEAGEPSAEVIDRLADGAEPGLMAISSPRFYGWVMGGTQPVALAADWLVSAWDQNTGLRNITPGTAAAEEIAGEWVVDLLGLPSGSEVGFTTGATMAQFSAMAAARDEVLRRAGWDAGTGGMAGGPAIRFVVGQERHGTVDLAGRYLGLGAPVVVPSDDQGRIRADELRATLGTGDGPAIVALQAGNIHSGAFDDFTEAIRVAHEAGAWVHVDGAFGLWAAASPQLRHLTAGMDGADSWSTDAHKTLSVPYDCGLAIVRDAAAMHRALSMHASYLQATDVGADPHQKVPELSRRARGVPTWAVLRSLGRTGVARLVDGLAAAARGIADGVGRLPGVEVLNDVVFTQVCIALEDDASTAALSEQLWNDGEVLAMTSTWRGRTVVRFSVSNWGTDAAQVARTVDAVNRALQTVRAGR